MNLFQRDAIMILAVSCAGIMLRIADAKKKGNSAQMRWLIPLVVVLILCLAGL